MPVGGGDQADAQRLHHPRRAGARRAGVEQVHQRDDGPVPRRRGGLRQPPLADLGQGQHPRLPGQPARHLPLPARPRAEPGQPGPDDGRAGQRAPSSPRALAADASSRGYYGTLSHNLRAVYNFYLGYYDANPATLHRAAAGRRGQALRRGDGRRGGGAGHRPQGLRRRRLPLGGRAGQPRGLRQPGQRRGARAAGRRAGAAGLPGRIGDLAQRLPDGRAGAAQRAQKTSAAAPAARTRCAA